MPRQFETPDVAGGPFRLGEWLVEPSLNRVSRGDTTIQLELKVMDVLVCLAERAGEVVTRFEIIDRVWATEFIADNTLTHAINEIRTALGDDARNPSFIETIHRRGYRLMVPVTLEERPAGTVAQFPSRAQEVRNKDLSPYPGLAAFTEADAEFFFGRENEVAQLWRKITSRRLLAVIGPSGVGKSSFLRAGVIPAKPDGWGILVCHPGEAPFAALARALLPEFRDDPEALSRATEFEANATSLFTRWRERHDRALLIVDQFEELFTLNTPDVQARYASLIGSLAREADVHVVLAMRDDFLYRCHAHDSLRPILEDLSALAQPDSEALRRSMTEPARRLEFAFEDEKLAEEMVSEVEGERGALPMLAFAAARLWEKRDREMRQLTRQAYQDIGGVAGALARHAEATLQGIGGDRLPIVREIFRNMVTAEGTRAVREWNELLSVFCDSSDESPEEVLRQLIDARLLTSYETREADDAPTRRIEIIHESLLANWPRLIRWQTQDADAVQLRDQLRQAARTWEEHDRVLDYLWTGKAFREFAVWRESYPGGLTELEEEFASSMTTHAKRRKRRRRIAVAAAFVALLVTLAIVGSFWQRSVREARRAEAANLLSMAQLELESYPSAAVAYATASLELSDSPAARRLALEALWKGPTAFVVNEVHAWRIAFSPDGRWLVQATEDPPHRIRVIGADGSDELLEDVHNGRVGLHMDRESGVFATWPWSNNEPWALWSAPEKRLLSKADHGGWPYSTDDWPGYPGNPGLPVFDLRRQRVLLMGLGGNRFSVEALGFDATSECLGTVPFDLHSAARCADAINSRWFEVSIGQGVYVIEFGDHELSEPRRIGPLEGPVVGIECDPLGGFVAAHYEDGQIRLWKPDGETPPRVIQGPSGITRLRISTDGSLLQAIKREKGETETWIWSLEPEEPTLLRHIDLGKTSGQRRSQWALNTVQRQLATVPRAGPGVRLWPLRAPADAEPVIMQRGDNSLSRSMKFHPSGGWLADGDKIGMTLWPVARPYPIVINQYEENIRALAFGPEGRWLATSSTTLPGPVRLWQLEGDSLPPGQIVHQAETFAYGIAASPDGKQILLGTHDRGVQLLSLDGEPPRTLPGVTQAAFGVAFSPDGRFAAAAGTTGKSTSSVIRVWDLASYEEVKVFDVGDDGNRGGIIFTKDGHLLYGRRAALLRWNLETGESELLYEDIWPTGITTDGSRVLLSKASTSGEFGRAWVVFDLETGAETPFETHGDRITSAAFDAAGENVVTGDLDGIIRVGPVTGEAPHMLLGHSGPVGDVAFDPLGRWIASASGTELRLWPMPDLSKPPLHTLPHEELIAKLKTLTNIRVVRDEASPTGWKLAHDPFPGWETVPEW